MHQLFKIASLVLAGVLLAGSMATTARSADHGPYPSNYKQLVLDWYARYLRDPQSMRFGGISLPRKEQIMEKRQLVYGYSVCAGVNAKNAFGGYTGMKSKWFFIRDGRILRVITGNQPIYIGRPVNCTDGPAP